jgi:lambda family phage portal protein
VFDWLRSRFGWGRGTETARPTPLRARYENAQTTPENQRSWWAVDYLSAKAANSFQVRRILRTRSRHEVANNPILFGVVHSNADDLIDTGPTIQVYTDNAKYNRLVEGSWKEWCEEVGLTEKVRTTKLAKSVDGEGFLITKTVEDLEHPVKLYPCDVEADQITTPVPKNIGELWVDGLELHPVTGKPTHYTVLKTHPGDYFFPDLNPLATERIQARHVVHWFTQSRPGQVRGVPIFTPSLDLFSELRAYRKAVLGAAEIAADYAAVMEQDREAGAYPDDDEDNDAEYQAFSRVPLSRKMLTVLPPGGKMNQLDPKQPTTTYEMFQEKCLGEACRPLSYPLNLALGTSQKFNFSSAKLDHINYRNSLSIERDQCAKMVLERIFRAWFEEAVLCGAIPAFQGLTVPPHEWHWPGYEPLDPVTDAQADHERLSNGSDTWQRFWARRGLDYRDVFRQQAAEQEEIDTLGLQFGEPASKTISETQDLTDDGSGTPPNKATAHRQLWRNFVRARAALLRATKDDNGQEHDDKGRFGEGGGGGEKDGSDKGDKKPNPEHAEHHDRWRKEDDEVETKREKEDDEVETKREKEDAVIEKSRQKQEQQTEKELAKKHAAENRQVERERAAEDKKTERDRSQEDKKVERSREKEDDELEREEERERERVGYGDKEEEMYGRQETEEKSLKEKHEQAHESLKRDVLDRVEKGELTAPEAQESIDEQRRVQERERKELVQKHMQEEQDLYETLETPKKKTEIEDQRDEEDGDREERRSEEDSKREENREKEDEEREERQSNERSSLERKWEREDEDREQHRSEEDEDRASKRDQEDAERYQQRKNDQPGAHEAYYDADNHKRHGDTKADAARRGAVHAH